MKNKRACLFSIFAFIISIALIFEGCKKTDNPKPTPTAIPTISSFSPASDTTGGTIVISGTNFSTNAAEDIVQINGVTATVISATSTQITVKVPNGASNGNITVSINGQTATSPTTFVLTQKGPAPVITKFSPAISGIGYPLVINGTGFNSDILSNAVTINGAQATVTVASDTQLIVTVPLTATTGKISVSVKGQTTVTSSDIRIIKLTVTTIAGSGSIGYADGTGKAAFFSGPWGIVGDHNGNYFIADGSNARIRKMTSAGVVTTLSGTSFQGNTDGPVATATFSEPFGIAMDSQGNLIVDNLGWNTIRKITPGGIVSTIAGNPSNATSGTANGTGTAARFNAPLGLAIDGSDNIFIADAGNRLIRKITTGGVVSTVAGGGPGILTNGTGTAASFNKPYSVCLDPAGNIYVIDAGNNDIRKITPAGVVTTFAGNGTAGSTDGPALSASFYAPICMVRDQAGNFYVTDESSHKIRMITSDGMVVTLAGNGTGASVDGVGNFASFYYPLGITIDSNGVMYMIDNGSATVRKMVVE